MSSVPQSAESLTPIKRTAFSASSEAGPSRARPAGSSPAYNSRRHSLYGIEDRIVIDPGSRIWKVGFSGEPDPRAVFWAQDDSDNDGEEIWDHDPGLVKAARGDREEGGRLIAVRLVKKLRETFVKHLMIDAKSRKVIIVESTFLPSFVKERIARALFDSLKVPSVSFSPASLLALAACGRITGLVIDCGWLETSITPVYYSRPLHHLARTTRLAGRALHSRLRVMLQYHANYISPPSSLEPGNERDRAPITPLPLSHLSDRLIERILTEGCFVEDVPIPVHNLESVTVDESSSYDQQDYDESQYMTSLKQYYAGSSSATDLRFNLPPSSGNSKRAYATLVVPGWVRARATEILFDGDDAGEAESLPDAILKCLLKLPVDLRGPLASSILVTGGTASLPGFIPRLRASILRLAKAPSTAGSNATDSILPYAARLAETTAYRRRYNEPYKTLYGLADKIAIMNDPAPLDGDGSMAGGKAPKWMPGMMSWVGGSLAGALKTGGPELLREEYDALCADALARADENRTLLDEAEAEIAALVGLDIDELLPGMALDGLGAKRKRGYHEGPILADWSRGVTAGLK